MTRVGRPALCLAATAFAAGVIHAQQAPAPTPAAIYSAAQVERGATLFVAKCATCHGGGSEASEVGPQLSGAGFWDVWAGRPTRRLYSRIISTMPASDPGSLSSDEALAITGFLAVQGEPTGRGVDAPAALDRVPLAAPAP